MIPIKFSNNLGHSVIRSYLFTLITVIATALLWVRTHYCVDDIQIIGKFLDVGFHFDLQSSAGGVQVFFVYATPWPPKLGGNPELLQPGVRYTKEPFLPWYSLREKLNEWTVWWFQFRRVKINGEKGIEFLFPIWILPPLVLALEYVRNFLRRHCKKTGICLKCGYDCRATPDRCPECGEPPALKISVSIPTIHGAYSKNPMKK